MLSNYPLFYRSFSFAIIIVDSHKFFVTFLYHFCMTSFLYCILYSYRSSNFCNSNTWSSFSFLKTIVKSKEKLSFYHLFEEERVITINKEKAIKKRSKELMPKIKQIRSITLQGAKRKIKYRKNRQFKSTNYFFLIICFFIQLWVTLGGITELSRPGFSKTLVLV